MKNSLPVIYQLRFSNGQIYIGQTKNYWQRIDRHLVRLRHGYHTERVQRAYNIFGKPKCEIVHYCTEYEDVDELEKDYIAGAGHRSLNRNHATDTELEYINDKEVLIRHRFLKDVIYKKITI